MRTHGWSGAAPASDDEAVARILDATGKAVDERGADVSIADVARTLGVTRQTVYRYFPSTEALLVAAAEHAAVDFLERLADHLQGITDPLDAVTEAIATALEWLPKDKHIGLLIVPGRVDIHTESVTSDVALQFANSMVRRFDVDWAASGFSDDELNELAEHLLRIIQSFVIDPGRPPPHRSRPSRLHEAMGGGRGDSRDERESDDATRRRSVVRVALGGSASFLVRHQSPALAKLFAANRGYGLL